MSNILDIVMHFVLCDPNWQNDAKLYFKYSI